MQGSISPLLTVKNLTVRFGGITALNDVSFTVKPHSITALIGPNGAGKTTVFNCITGFYRPTQGSLTLAHDGRHWDLVQLLGAPPRARDALDPRTFPSKLYYYWFGGSHLVTRAGVARTFQNIRLFPEMTVFENLLVAQHLRANRNPFQGLFLTPAYRLREKELVTTAAQWLDIVGLGGLGNELAAALPYGHQRRLEIARAMCTNPRLVCLDEPAAGLNPTETDDLARLIKRLNEEFKVTVFVIEHDMSLVMDISHEVVVLNYGQVIAANSPASVRQDPAVLAAYLGTDEEEAIHPTDRGSP